MFHSPADLPVVRKGLASVVTVHHLNPPDLSNVADGLFVEKLKALCHQVTVILTVSNYTKRNVLEELRVPESKVRVIYNGVDHNVFRPISDSKGLEETHQKYNLPETFILYTAGINRRKNLHTVVRALDIAREETGWPVSLVVGGGVYDSRYFHEVKQELTNRRLEKAVIFLGHLKLKDLVHLMNLARAFVYPSFGEGFGRAVLEAMACGCPVIVSNATSLPEVVGDAGVLVDPHSARDFATAIEAVLDNKNFSKVLHAKGLKRASQFSWERAALETLDAYRVAAEMQG